MSHLPLAFGALCACVLFGGCATLTPRQPLKMSEDDFRARVTTLCLLPLRVPPLEIPDEKERAAAFEAALTATLRHAGFTVPAPEQTAEAIKRALESVGGLYDPHTGERVDEAAFKAGRRRALQIVAKELGCSAIGAASIAMVTTPFNAGTAYWDGVRYSVGGSHDSMGWAGALSLWVSIRDLNDEELFFCTGGIQPTFSVSSAFFTGSRFGTVEDSEILEPGARTEQAIQTCLGPLVRRSAIQSPTPALSP